ncbi:hypothetical protein [Halorhabdus rudnickae]|uniref:hypothetical protein n=1 Tax=Halorhabdus rudnickae TaxID=1775544 RepID=UPI001082AA78|nr:hypothetical protein [Halorhabdus rudnickae]
MSDSKHPERGDGLPSRTRAHRGGGRSVREGPPGRETALTKTTYRRNWVGIGNRAGTELDRFGMLLSDLGRIIGEVAILTPPFLFVLFLAPLGGPYSSVFELFLVAWPTMILVGTLLRGGWIAPPLTEVPGWVRLFPTLILLRLLYFNGTLVVAIYGGQVVANVTATIAIGLVWSLIVAAASMLLFPRVVDEWMARLT